MTYKKLEGKVAIITGASRGLGRGLSKAFATCGARLAVCARNEASLASLKQEIEDDGGECFFQTCDVMHEKNMQSFVEAVIAHYGRVDILLNNAQKMPSGQMPEFDNAIFSDVVDSGIKSTNVMMNLVQPYMKAQGGGKILNFTSNAGTRGAINAAQPYPAMSGYAAAKMGIVGLTKAAASLWGAHNINVNCVAPLARTESVDELLETMGLSEEAFSANPPGVLGRMGDIQTDIAPPCAFLCSDEANYITGTILAVDGGMSELG